MTYRLTSKDIIALGFMTFSLFVGAGNIIFPPMVGLHSGEHLWIAACGFMVTAVGLPVITVIALANVRGGIDVLSSPLGKVASILLAVICHLAIGPLFAMPRTATVSFEIGIAPLIGDNSFVLLCYSLIYFSLVIGVSLYPGKLLDTIGYVLAPLKISALTVLGVTVILYSENNTMITTATDIYQRAAFSSGFISGYLTMDTLGALVFGIVIVNAVRSRGIEEENLITYYIILAGLIAGAGLTLVYLSLFKLGAGSSALITQHANGAEILHAYVQHIFGSIGSLFLAILIFIACIITAVGLTCACSEFFERYLPFSYKMLVLILGLFSMIVSNLGLSYLITFSIPVLTAVYPPCIILVILSFTMKWWNKRTRIIMPTVFTSFVFGIIDAIKATNLKDMLSVINQYLPFLEQDLTWLFPTMGILFIAAIVDRIMG